MMGYLSRYRTSKKRIGGEAERESNIELFRIVIMLLIISHHYVVNSGLLNTDGCIYSSEFGFKSFFYLAIGAWGKAGINCFIMITGYYMCKKTISFKKIFKLLLEVVFYNIVICLAFCLTGYGNADIKMFIKAIFPINSLSRNFTGCFFAFYLLIPFINILLNHLSEKQHILLMVILGFMYVVLGTGYFGLVEMNYVSWFTVIYLFAAYIRLYPKPIFNNRRMWGVITLIIIILTFISFPIIYHLTKRLFGQPKGLYILVSDTNHVVPLLFGISAFLYFINVKIKPNGLINLLGASTFGVFCIHTNGDLMRKWLWIDLFKVVEAAKKEYYYLHVVGTVLLIYIACSMIDIMRKKMIEDPFFGKTWNLFEGFINNLAIRVSKKYDHKTASQ